ncbi:hypothetical protein Sden_2870 [Shewanella denitrificans OS217]|jgi:hypothetical protein|uniref:DUF4402 domain-containing protein n=1 Tax=Shewanella denitrificans (strain OS217 / ATCC BAA-1090 / DSM 15013) TaxID=318161 RepID=Q12K77_SHEDO|nr:hypothetical protein [Shewanella denitrificans]ABE56149.1 hypothetical protein Sden_2870 [Shewanella denitrificans OS217]
MTNKLLLSTLIASSLLIASQANAADGTGTANFNLVAPITVTEATQMQLGDISILADGSCAIDTSGTLTGSNCVAGGAAEAAGSFTIAAANGTVNLSVSGADTSVSGVTFTPSLDSATTTVVANAATVNVAGSVAIVSASAATGAQALSYTLSVVY